MEKNQPGMPILKEDDSASMILWGGFSGGKAKHHPSCRTGLIQESVV